MEKGGFLIKFLVGTNIFFWLLVLIFMILLQIINVGNMIFYISPSHYSLDTWQGEQSVVQFSLKADTNYICRIKCDYEFKDISDANTLDNGTIIISRNQDFKKDYRIISPESGYGQKIYNFNVTCNNERSLACWVRSPIKHVVSVVVVNYKPAESKEETIKQIENDLSAWLINLSLLDIDNKKIGMQIETLNSSLELNEINEQKRNREENLDYLANIAEYLRNLWDGEGYEEIKENMNSSLQMLFLETSADIETAETNLSDTLSRHNDIIGNIEEDKSAANLVINFFASTFNFTPNNTIDSAKIFLANLSGLISDFQSLNFSTYEDIEWRLNALSKDYGEINNVAVNNSGEILYFGYNLINQSYNRSIHEDLFNNILELEVLCGEIVNNTNQTQDIKNFIDQYCDNINASLAKINTTLFSNTDFLNVHLSYVRMPYIERAASRINITLKEHLPVCCIFGKCETCCINDSCTEPSLYPIILLHGHAFNLATYPLLSLDIFNKMQTKLQSDGYVAMGTVVPESNYEEVKEGSWGRIRNPVTVKASYYVNVYNERGEMVKELEASENIENYSKRLKGIIDLIEYRTGRPKVNIIAHSMGSLVTRKYLQLYGEDSIYNLIMVATPNFGLKGKVGDICTIKGRKEECSDMMADSDFLNELNKYKPVNKTKFFTITGSGCKMDNSTGDGVVIKSDAELPYAENYGMTGNCSIMDVLHLNIMDTEKYPQVYEKIKEILEES